jgi:hypothetical protein
LTTTKTSHPSEEASLNQIYNSIYQKPNIDPELAAYLAEKGIVMPGYAEGSRVTDNPLVEAFSKFSEPTKFVRSEPHMLQTHVTSHQSPLGQLKQLRPGIGMMAKGGLPAHYQEAAPPGHHPEFVTGLTGYYADGGGTGQSDDIPAMLHDGDYVMDAETVSALGDGSSKAGRNVLDEFRQRIPHHDKPAGNPVPAKIADGEYVFPAAFVTALGGGDNKKGADILDGLREKLRQHKRAAPINKIPPKAKDPMQYIRK